MPRDPAEPPVLISSNLASLTPDLALARTNLDSRIGVGTARHGLRERFWSGLTGVIRKRPILRSMIDVGRSVTSAFSGEHCTCTLCGHVGRFLPFGAPLRPSATCPQCGSLERHRLIGLYVKARPEIIAGKTVLHFAPERPVTHLLLATAPGLYRTADIEVGRADLQLSLEKLALANACVDVLIAIHILEHVDDRAALAEIFRVLVPGGRALIMVPIVEGWDQTYENGAVKTDAERVRHFGQSDHVRFYGNDLRDRIKAAGFELDEVTSDPANSLRYGLLRGEKIFVAIKPLPGA